MHVFSSRNYRKFLKKWLSTNEANRTQADFARVAQCSPSWITRVLAGEVHFTPDQAYAIGQFMALTSDESDYFCLLVDWERAATPALKKRCHEKLSAIAEKSRGFQTAIESEGFLSEPDCLRYYSSWVYAAVHVACMMTPFSEEDLALRFGVSRQNTKSVLTHLQTMGLVMPQMGTWRATSKNLHLPADKMMSTVGHSIWRNQVIDHLQRGETDGLHYSAIHCLARTDVVEVSELLKAAVLDCRKVIDRSSPDTLGVLCLDWFEPTRHATR